MTPDETGRGGELDQCESCGVLLKTLRNVEHFQAEDQLAPRYFQASCSCGADKGWDNEGCLRCYPPNSMCTGCSGGRDAPNSSCQPMLWEPTS